MNMERELKIRVGELALSALHLNTHRIECVKSGPLAISDTDAYAITDALSHVATVCAKLGEFLLKNAINQGESVVSLAEWKIKNKNSEK